ncbi:MAG: hypothetical protein IPP90_03650 [Gemmatimonadaceae bacterium]|nr:hypothetical protein [Gemmatimonadaceae bacterium]
MTTLHDVLTWGWTSEGGSERHAKGVLQMVGREMNLTCVAASSMDSDT